MRTRRLLRIGVVMVVALGGAVGMAAPAAAAGMDLIEVTAQSATDSSDEKSVSAYCPAGRRVIGGGAVMGGNIDVHITGMRPDPLTNSFTAYASEHGPGNWPWYVTAYAVCAANVGGLVYVSDFTGGDSAATHSEYAWCPGGTKVLGVGGRVTAPDPRKVLLTYVKPTGTGNGAEVGGVEITGGYAGNWWLYTWAVCAPEPAGWDVVAAANAPGQSYATFLCQYPKKLTGGGGYISLSLGEVYLIKIRIDQWSTPDGRDTWPGGVAAEASWVGGSARGPGHDWYIKAYGVCVD